jgi:hypothetical protein
VSVSVKATATVTGSHSLTSLSILRTTAYRYQLLHWALLTIYAHQIAKPHCPARKCRCPRPIACIPMYVNFHAPCMDLLFFHLCVRMLSWLQPPSTSRCWDVGEAKSNCVSSSHPGVYAQHIACCLPAYQQSPRNCPWYYVFLYHCDHLLLSKQATADG